VLLHRDRLQEILSWLARRMGRSAGLAISDPRANKAETVFRRWCRVGCGEIVPNSRISQFLSLLSSSSQKTARTDLLHHLQPPKQMHLKPQVLQTARVPKPLPQLVRHAGLLQNFLPHRPRLLIIAIFPTSCLLLFRH
jgi:hypothetical protein